MSTDNKLWTCMLVVAMCLIVMDGGLSPVFTRVDADMGTDLALAARVLALEQRMAAVEKHVGVGVPAEASVVLKASNGFRLLGCRFVQRDDGRIRALGTLHYVEGSKIRRAHFTITLTDGKGNTMDDGFWIMDFAQGTTRTFDVTLGRGNAKGVRRVYVKWLRASSTF
jgi:hypothetical protein